MTFNQTTGTLSRHETTDRELFDRIAGSYCGKDLTPSCAVARKLRLTQTIQSAQLPRDATILEVGCGAGFSAQYLEGRYKRFVGVDYSQELIRLATHYNDRPGVTFEAKNVHDFSTEETFDGIFMVGVLHHMEDMTGAIRDISRLLKPNGVLIANEPQPANPCIRVARAIRKKTDLSYSEDQLQLSKSDLREILNEGGLVDVQVTPQGLFSTPFAEVPLGPQWLTTYLSRFCCGVDRIVERTAGNMLGPFSWNLIASGKKSHPNET